MDYSTYPNDPENPAGSSPWTTSPAPNKSSFPTAETASEPPSPAAQQGVPTSKLDHEEPQQDKPPPREGGASDQEEPYSPISEAPPPQNGIGKSPGRTNSSSIPDIRFQDQPLTEEELRAKQLQQQRQQERYQQALHAQQHQRGPGPNRYHQGGQGHRQPPRYKLQAKIINLERTGKKDPIITFDVHVSPKEICEKARLIFP